MKLSDFANLNSTARGGLQVLIGDNLALQVPKALESAVSGLLDRSTVHAFARADGTTGQTGKLGYVRVEFHSSSEEGLGWLDGITRDELQLASAAAVFGAPAPTPAEPGAESAEVID